MPAGESWLLRLVNVRKQETAGWLVSFAALFCLFTGYASLRPMRDSMGISLGSKQLGGLFGWTFAAMLAVIPIFGWLASRFPRRIFLPAVYSFFILNLLGFYVLFLRDPSNVLWMRLFFVWVSVVNLFVVSAFWSLMADLHDREQGIRLFGSIAAGSSLGSVIGPGLTALLVKRVGTANLLLLAAGFFCAAVLLLLALLRRNRHSEAPGSSPALVKLEERPLGGNPLAGIWLVGKSPYLLGISLFVFLLSATATFLYLEQAALLSRAIPDPSSRTRLLATVDTVVNILSLSMQLFLVGRLTVRVGVALTLLLVPALLCAGFLMLALAPGLGVLLGVMIVRRAGEYALLRPSRELLFISVDRQSKYKAKSFIDTVVYRGADWANAKLHELLLSLGLATSGVALAGAVVAAAWGLLGFVLGRRLAALTDGQIGGCAGPAHSPRREAACQPAAAPSD